MRENLVNYDVNVRPTNQPYRLAGTDQTWIPPLESFLSPILSKDF